MTFQAATRLLALLPMFAASLAFAQPEFQSIQIPRVSEPPKIEEFLGMELPAKWLRRAYWRIREQHPEQQMVDFHGRATRKPIVCLLKPGDFIENWPGSSMDVVPIVQ